MLLFPISCDDDDGEDDGLVWSLGWMVVWGGTEAKQRLPRASGVAFDPGYLTVFESRDFSKPH